MQFDQNVSNRIHVLKFSTAFTWFSKIRLQKLTKLKDFVSYPKGDETSSSEMGTKIVEGSINKFRSKVG